MTLRIKATGLFLTVAALGCLATLAETSRAGDKKNVAATPSPRMGKDGKPDARWLKQHEGYVEIAKKGNFDVLLVGDSITEGWNANKYFPPLKGANFGISGDRTEHVLWRLQNGEQDGIKPKVMVLMIGTNNTASNSAEEIAEGITAIVKFVQAKLPQTKVLLLAIFPRGEKPGTPVRDKIAAINKTISKLDDGGKTVLFMDIGSKFRQLDGSLTKDITPDFLHLTARAREIWGNAIGATVQKMAAQAGGAAK